MGATVKQQQNLADVARAVGALWVEALYRAQQLSDVQADVLTRFVAGIDEDFCFVGEPYDVLGACEGDFGEHTKQEAWRWLANKRHIVNIGGDLYCLGLEDEQLEFLLERCEDIGYTQAVALIERFLK